MTTKLFPLAVLLGASFSVHAATVRLDELDLTAFTQGWGQAQPGLSVTKTPLRIAGKTFAHGVGTHAESDVTVRLDGQAQTFTAQVGVDDNARNAAAAIEFILYGDGRELWRSGVCHVGDQPHGCSVPLAGLKSLELTVTANGDGINYDHADWADATFAYDGAPPQTVKSAAPVEEAVLLTPPPPHEPRINGPAVYGLHPGSPFLYRIPCTGDRPMTFRAENLPSGLALDSATGIITGQAATAGTVRVKLFAKNALGETSRELRLEIGKQLALTPPMGWNSWYIYYNHVTEADLRTAADQMIASGMADFGYQYVNCDDCWNVRTGSNDPELGGPPRTADGELLPNKRFPDIKGMVAHIHAQGLRAGIYISPGPQTCAGFEGSLHHEAQDARTFAAWGFDFLKYDWCSYQSQSGGATVADYRLPYQQMWDEVRKQNRDIVFNLCQYGMGDVWKWGGEVGHCWRTTGDLGNERDSRLPGFYSIGLSNARHWEYAHPGAWNDPDYILIGWIGAGFGKGFTRTKLTPNEQYTYLSLWSLMAAPLIFSGDMSKLDPFTLNVLCNTEVIGVDQDPLGKQGRILRQTRDELVMVRDLADGSKAVGLFNLSPRAQTVSVAWSDLGVAGKQTVHDVWRQQDLGRFAAAYQTEIPRHGVAFLRLTPAQ